MSHNATAETSRQQRTKILLLMEIVTFKCVHSVQKPTNTTSYKTNLFKH